MYVLTPINLALSGTILRVVGVNMVSESVVPDGICIGYEMFRTEVVGCIARITRMPRPYREAFVTAGYVTNSSRSECVFVSISLLRASSLNTYVKERIVSEERL